MSVGLCSEYFGARTCMLPRGHSGPHGRNERTYTEAEVLEASHAATAAAYERAADANCYYCKAREWWKPINEVGIHVAIPGNQVTDGICKSRDILALINPADANALDERIRRERLEAGKEWVIAWRKFSDCIWDHDEFEQWVMAWFAALRSPATKDSVTEIHKPGQIPVNDPACDRCGKMFLECQCSSLDGKDSGPQEVTK